MLQKQAQEAQELDDRFLALLAKVSSREVPHEEGSGVPDASKAPVTQGTDDDSAEEGSVDLEVRSPSSVSRTSAAAKARAEKDHAAGRSPADPIVLDRVHRSTGPLS